MAPIIPGVQAVIVVDYQGEPIDVGADGALKVSIGDSVSEVKTVNSTHGAATTVTIIAAVATKKIKVLFVSAINDPGAALATAIRFAFAGVENKKVYGGKFAPGKGFVGALGEGIVGGTNEPLQITLDAAETVEYTVHYREI